jgi:hypothetical protein
MRRNGLGLSGVQLNHAKFARAGVMPPELVATPTGRVRHRQAAGNDLFRSESSSGKIHFGIVNLIHEVASIHSRSAVEVTHRPIRNSHRSARPGRFEILDCWSLGCPDLSICE